MVRPLWVIKTIKKLFPRRHFLAKLTKIPGIGKLTDFLLFHNDELYILPKDHSIINTYTINLNKKVEMANDIVIPSKVVEYFIEKANYHFILDSCLCRSAENCKNYPIDLGCLFLGEAVLKIDQRLGKLVSKEEAMSHVQKCQQAGLIHLIGRNKLDTQWLDVKPGNKLLTICNCCECCCLWKFIPSLNAKIARKISKLPNIEIEITGNCIGCGECTRGICFTNAIRLEDNKAKINPLYCKGCGKCITICPQFAIDIKIKNADFLNEIITRIDELVDVT